MPAAQRALVGIPLHVQPLAGELRRAAHIHQLAARPDMLQHLVAEGAEAAIVAFRSAVGGRRVGGLLPRQGLPFALPLKPPAVHDPRPGVAEQLEDPEGIRRPPVALVAIEDHSRLRRDGDARSQGLKPFAIQIVAPDRVVQIGRPVNLHRSRDMPGGIQQRIFIRFNDAHRRIVQVRGHPPGGNQHIRARIAARFDCSHQVFSFLRRRAARKSRPRR